MGEKTITPVLSRGGSFSDSERALPGYTDVSRFDRSGSATPIRTEGSISRPETPVLDEGRVFTPEGFMDSYRRASNPVERADITRAYQALPAEQRGKLNKYFSAFNKYVNTHTGALLDKVENSNYSPFVHAVAGDNPLLGAMVYNRISAEKGEEGQNLAAEQIADYLIAGAGNIDEEQVYSQLGAIGDKLVSSVRAKKLYNQFYGESIKSGDTPELARAEAEARSILADPEASGSDRSWAGRILAENREIRERARK